MIMRRILITGASRGIGRAIANAFAMEEPCIITLLGRSLSRPSHNMLRGTLLQTAEEVESKGSVALPLQVNLRDAEEVKRQTKQALAAMGGCDVVIHNASVMSFESKNVDLLYQVNLRSVLLINELCRSSLVESSHGSIVSLSPPVRMAKLDWISAHPAYTISKYGMTLATLAEANGDVRANCLWPRYTVATAATKRLERVEGFAGAFTEGRCPSTTAKAVMTLATTSPHNGACLFDDDVIPLPPTDAPLDIFASPDVRHLRSDKRMKKQDAWTVTP